MRRYLTRLTGPQLPARTAGVAAALSLGVAIGIGASLFAFVDAVLLSPFPYPDADRLVLLWGNTVSGRGLSLPNLADIERQTGAIENLAAYVPAGEVSLEGDQAVDGVFVSVDVFTVLGVSPTLGTVGDLDSDRQGDFVVLGHELWEQNYASNPDILGQTIRLNGSPHVAVAVMPPGFFFPDLSSEAWLSLPTDYDASRGARVVNAVARLAPGVKEATAQAELDTVTAGLTQAYP